MNRRTRLASTVVLLSATGCIRVETTTVHVRDPQQVEVLAGGVRVPLRPPWPTSASVASGRFAQWLSLRPYEIDVDRKPGGALALRCDACGDAGWSPNRTGWTREEALIDANGALAPTGTRLVTSDAAWTQVGYDRCMMASSIGSPPTSICDVHARLALLVPASDLVEVDNHSVPIRPLGWGALAVGLGLLGVSTFILASSDIGSFAQRAPWGFGIALPALALTGWGAWLTFAPAQDEVIRARR